MPATKLVVTQGARRAITPKAVVVDLAAPLVGLRATPEKSQGEGAAMLRRVIPDTFA